MSATPDDAVAVEFQFTEAEFRAAMRAVTVRVPVMRLLLALGVLLTAIGVLIVVLDGDSLFLFVGIAELLYAAYLVVVAPRRQWRKVEAARGLQRFRFSDAGIDIETVVSRAHVEWRLYRKVVETKDLFFFMVGRMGCNPIPKRAFGSGDERRFVALARRQVPA